MGRRQTGITLDEGVLVKDDELDSVPLRFNVVMHNDHYTTMEFVVEVLMTVFHKDEKTATGLMLQIHNEGKAVAGTYPYDVAQTKATHTMKMARQAGFPLKCTVEER